MSRVDCAGVLKDARGSSVDAVKELVTLWTATPMLRNAVPIWKAGQGLSEDRVASATGAPVTGLMPQNPAGTAGSSRKPRPRTKKCRNPAPSRWKLLSAPLPPAIGPTRYTPRYLD